MNNTSTDYITTKLSRFSIIKLTVEVLIALFGIFGNVLVAVVIKGLGKKKTTTDLYLLNLAIADLGILLLTFPLVAIRENAPTNWPLGEFVCLYSYPIPEIFHGTSVWFIVVIAIVRYREIVIPRKAIRNKNKISLKYAKTTAVCIWVASFLLFSLPFYFVVSFGLPPGEVGVWCGPIWPSLIIAQLYLCLLTTFGYIIPLGVICWTYLAISRAINRSSNFLFAMKRGQDGAEGNLQVAVTGVQSIRLRQNKRAKKILTPVVVVFAITMFPLTILRLTLAFWPSLAEKDYYENTLFAVTLFVIANSSANPVIYSIASKSFRKGMTNLYSKCLIKCL
ncbi:somatostatin receptor type 5-like [Stylophora pistillata]|uniref:Somatostatin receptor type 5 n=1 Tax=Stylophora pistillata TaxID=50429 RepID=A0A2B4RQG7_STYPI|nr:somatostatin receptor type 5-like [Stylophora pistillata]PFX18587.1 Somatostatin receptor type 5 [Stylophora pistillata]